MKKHSPTLFLFSFRQKQIITFLLTLVMIFLAFPSSIFAQGNEIASGLNNFTQINSYKTGQFTDVDSNTWYEGSVARVYELGLMKGNSSNTFNPNGNITQAEALTLTARIHKIYNTGNDDFSDIKQEMLSIEPAVLAWCNYDKNCTAYKEFYEAWYAPYVYYLYTRVEPEYDGEYPQFPAFEFDPQYAPFIDSQLPLIRLRFISAILFGALPEREFAQINTIANNAIPDVESEYFPSIYTLYRAGIIAGNDSYGTFAPYSYITRAEVAAMATRMIDSSLRLSFSLESKEDEPTIEKSAPLSEPTNSSILPFSFEKNSVDGIKVCWKARNLSGKTINYYTVRVYFYNAVGDPAFDEHTYKSYKDVKYVGPVLPNEEVVIYNIVGYVPACSKIVLGETILEYSDGTTEEFWYGWSTTHRT